MQYAKLLPRCSGASDLPDQPFTNTSNPYLPDGCMTYDSRYSEYRDEAFFANRCCLVVKLALRIISCESPRVDLTVLCCDRTAAWAPNTLKPHANKAVIMRIHSQTNFKPDLILAFRALMSEAHENDYHTIFLTTVIASQSYLNQAYSPLTEELMPPQIAQQACLRIPFRRRLVDMYIDMSDGSAGPKNISESE